MSDAPDSRREAWLVLRVQSGDLAALDALLAATQRWLHPFLVRLVADADVADDTLQEVLLRIHRKLCYLRDARAYRAWVYRLAAREAIRNARSQRRRHQREVDDELLGSAAGSELPQALEADEVALLRQKTELLTPNIRAVIVLHYFEGLSLREVADVLEIAIGTVKSRLAVGLTEMRREM